MAYKTPKDIAEAGVATGATKARLSWDEALVPLAAMSGRASLSKLAENWVVVILPAPREQPVGAR